MRGGREEGERGETGRKKDEKGGRKGRLGSSPFTMHIAHGREGTVHGLERGEE